MNDFRRAALRPSLLGLLLALSMPGRTEPLPLWEIGAGAAIVNLPDYRGSDVRSTYILPAPYLVYRGRFLRADREGVRAAFFESDRLDVNLSLNVGLASRGKNNPLRQGMEALRPTFEIGPTADFKLWHADDGKAALTLRVPVRAAVTIASSPQHIGWLFSPNLHIRVRDPRGWPGWKISAQAGPVIATRDFNDYFYSVRPEQAAPGRPAYAAAGGYAGVQAGAILSRRFPHHWFGAYLRYDNLNGAVFADSPLVRRRSALTAGIAVTWVFGTSHVMVDADD